MTVFEQFYPLPPIWRYSDVFNQPPPHSHMSFSTNLLPHIYRKQSKINCKLSFLSHYKSYMMIWPNPLPQMTVLWRFEQTPSLSVIWYLTVSVSDAHFEMLLFLKANNQNKQVPLVSTRTVVRNSGSTELLSLKKLSSLRLSAAAAWFSFLFFICIERKSTHKVEKHQTEKGLLKYLTYWLTSKYKWQSFNILCRLIFRYIILLQYILKKVPSTGTEVPLRASTAVLLFFTVTKLPVSAFWL